MQNSKSRRRDSRRHPSSEELPVPPLVRTNSWDYLINKANSSSEGVGNSRDIYKRSPKVQQKNKRQKSIESMGSTDSSATTWEQIMHSVNPNPYEDTSSPIGKIPKEEQRVSFARPGKGSSSFASSSRAATRPLTNNPPAVVPPRSQTREVSPQQRSKSVRDARDARRKRQGIDGKTVERWKEIELSKGEPSTPEPSRHGVVSWFMGLAGEKGK